VIEKRGEVMPDINWIRIKTEYINTNISYRKLAEKYQVSFPTLRDRAKNENWVNLRNRQHDKTVTKTLQKTAEKISEQEADYTVNIKKINYRLASVVSWMLNQKEVIEEFRPSDIKQLTGALKDIKEIQAGNENDKNDSIEITLRRE